MKSLYSNIDYIIVKIFVEAVDVGDVGKWGRN